MNISRKTKKTWIVIFGKGISIPSAVLKTRNEANEFENKLLKFAEDGKRNKLNGLSSFFKPLVDGKIELKFEKDKAKWPYKRGWLRIYAIRMGVNHLCDIRWGN